MERVLRAFPQLFLIFLIWAPVSARKCCKENVAQSQLGCINADVQTILDKVCKIVQEIVVEGGCGSNITLITQSDIPYTTPSSGHYCLTEDVTVAGGATGITINQNNVTLDLNGFHITGGTNGVLSSSNDVAIFGGTVQGATTGMSITGGRNVHIDSVLLRNNGTGLNDTGGSNVSISDTAINNNTGNGFSLISNNHDLEHVIANGNGGNGLAVTSGNTLSVHDSYFEGNTTRGIQLTGLENFCFERIAVQNNGDDGIELAGTTTAGSIVDSCINGNAGNGLEATDSTASISICRNIVSGNIGIGIFLSPAGPTNNIQVIENKVLSNGKLILGAVGINIGGGVWVNGTTAGGVATTHTVFANIAQNNGTTPGTLGTNDTNYSQNVKALTTTQAELRSTVAAGVGQLENITI